MGSDTTLHRTTVHYIAIAAHPHHHLTAPSWRICQTTRPRQPTTTAPPVFFLPLASPTLRHQRSVIFLFCVCFSLFRSLVLRTRPPPVTPPPSPFSHQRVNLPRPAQPPFSFTVLQSHPCADTREQDDSTQRRSDPTSLIQPLHVLRARSQTDGLIGPCESSSSFTPGVVSFAMASLGVPAAQIAANSPQVQPLRLAKSDSPSPSRMSGSPRPLSEISPAEKRRNSNQTAKVRHSYRRSSRPYHSGPLLLN